MSGLDKILDAITQEGEDASRVILAQAEEKANTLRQQRQTRAQGQAEEILAQAPADAAKLRENARNAAQAAAGRKALETRVECVQAAIAAALGKLRALPHPEKEALLEKLLDRFATGAPGEILLPEGFEPSAALAEKLRKKLLTPVQTAAVPDGFILRYGNIEENCTLEALLEENREAVCDRAAQVLFGEGR